MVLEIVQKSPYNDMSKLLFSSSMPSLLQFVVVDLMQMLVVVKAVFNPFLPSVTLLICS